MGISLLQELLERGLLEIGDSDDRFEKLQRAVQDLADRFAQDPSHIVPAVLVALDPNAPASEPSFAMAKEAVTGHWPTFAGRFKDEPRTILRMILFSGIQEAASNSAEISAIAWLTAASVVRYMQLGREEEPFRRELDATGERVEKWAEEQFAYHDEARIADPKWTPIQVPEVGHLNIAASSDDVDRFTLSVSQWNSAGQQRRSAANPYDPTNNLSSWAAEFGKRIPNAILELVGPSIHALAEVTSNSMKSLVAVLEQRSKELVEYSIQASRSSIVSKKAENLRLRALWWSQALYSQSLRQSYRDVNPATATFAMASDLHNIVGAPTPASLAHFLGETIRRLTGSDAEVKIDLAATLQVIANDHRIVQIVPTVTSHEGRLCLMDAAGVIVHKRSDPATLLRDRTGLGPTLQMTLPAFGMALFRDLQAKELAKQLFSSRDSARSTEMSTDRQERGQ